MDKILKKLARRGKPSKKFDKILQRRLKENFEKNYHSPISFFTFKKFKLQIATAFIITTLTGTSIFAYSNEKVTSEHPLYPIKRKIENVEGWLANTPEKKEQYHEKMSQRRLDELHHLKKEGQHFRDTIKEGFESRNLFMIEQQRHISPPPQDLDPLNTEREKPVEENRTEFQAPETRRDLNM
jgi:hypothetical protein